MRYWAYLVAKLIAAGALLWVLRGAVRYAFPKPDTFMYSFVRPDPFMHDLPYTFTMWFLSMVAAGVVWLIVWDQRYRCRTCLRRLRMPITAGSWPNMLLFGQPRIDYICLYGHGTLKVPEIQINGPNSPDWEPHDEDIWKELESLEESSK
jgi:hypothetical protein